MALDVGICPGSNSKNPLEREMVVSLVEVDIAFLFEAIEDIKNKTGVEIVPWDDAKLEGAQLDLLDSHLIERIEVANQKPKIWKEYIGFRVKPRKKIYASMVRIETLDKLKRLV